MKIDAIIALINHAAIFGSTEAEGIPEDDLRAAAFEALGEALVAFGAVDKDDKETDLLAMLRALLEV